MKQIIFTFIVLIGLISESCTHKYFQDKEEYSILFDTVFKVAERRFEVYTFEDSKKHGVMRFYDLDYGIREERLYLNDRLMLSKQFGGDSSLYGYTCFNNDEYNKLYPIGSMVFDIETDKPVQRMCTFYEVIAPDTILFGEPYRIKVQCYMGNFEDFKVILTLGVVGSDFSMNQKLKELKSDNTQLEFVIQKYQIGINILTGHLTYLENGKDITSMFRISESKAPLIFYKQFVVLPPSP